MGQAPQAKVRQMSKTSKTRSASKPVDYLALSGRALGEAVKASGMGASDLARHVLGMEPKAVSSAMGRLRDKFIVARDLLALTPEEAKALAAYDANGQWAYLQCPDGQRKALLGRMAKAKQPMSYKDIRATYVTRVAH